MRVTKKTKIIIAVVILAGILMGVFASGFMGNIFKDDNTTAENVNDNKNNSPSPSVQSDVEVSQNAQDDRLSVRFSANPLAITLDPQVTGVENLQRSILRVSYTNRTSSEITGVKIRITFLKQNDFAIGGSQTTILNKELSQEPEGPFIFDAPNVAPQESQDAIVNIIPRKNGSLSFRAEVLLEEKTIAETEEITIDAN